MLRCLLVLVAAVLWTAATAAPAAAHVGPVTLTVSGDGATGVTITAVHEDGHPLEGAVPIKVTATGSNGRTVGPVSLLPAGEGLGFYTSGPLLDPGRWQVRVVAPEPTPGIAEVAVDARAGTASSTPPAAALPPESDGIGTRAAVWWAIGFTAVAALVAALALRRRTPDPPPNG